MIVVAEVKFTPKEFDKIEDVLNMMTQENWSVIKSSEPIRTVKGVHKIVSKSYTLTREF